jgi:cell division septation protein DedD
MRNSETGELELVVGNRQLLSAFFIVVLLFAVAFAMGYVVGQNSPKALHAAAAEPSTVALTPAESRPQPAQSAQPSAAPTKEAPSATVPAQSEPAPQSAAAAQNPPTPAPAELPAGSYWQVMAVPQHEADIMMNTLKDKGFPTQLTQGPKDLMRVLVGPYSDRQSLGKAKTDLENLGLHPIMR